jgi:hypothetical protein
MKILSLIALVGSLAAAAPALAQSADDLAKKLSNPVADLISVPFQYNYNGGIGDGDGQQNYINIQPVIPISIGKDWNLISRTILPVVSQSDFTPTYGTKTGLGNITQSFFFSPKQPTGGIADNQWGAGVTGVALKQAKGWTVGVLANHIWSIGSEDRYGNSSATYLQPFLSYSTKKATSYSVNTEATYNWETEDWSVPINFTVGQIVKIGGKPVQLTAGARYWADTPEGGPDGWGARLVVTYLFPKKG